MPSCADGECARSLESHGRSTAITNAWRRKHVQCLPARPPRADAVATTIASDPHTRACPRRPSAATASGVSAPRSRSQAAANVRLPSFAPKDDGAMTAGTRTSPLSVLRYTRNFIESPTGCRTLRRIRLRGAISVVGRALGAVHVMEAPRTCRSGLCLLRRSMRRSMRNLTHTHHTPVQARHRYGRLYSLPLADEAAIHAFCACRPRRLVAERAWSNSDACLETRSPRCGRDCRSQLHNYIAMRTPATEAFRDGALPATSRL